MSGGERHASCVQNSRFFDQHEALDRHQSLEQRRSRCAPGLAFIACPGAEDRQADLALLIQIPVVIISGATRISSVRQNARVYCDCRLSAPCIFSARMKPRTSAIAVRPAEEVRYGRCLREVGVEHPVDHERRVFVWRILRANDERSQKVRPILICAHEDGICRPSSATAIAPDWKRETRHLVGCSVRPCTPSTFAP